MKISVCGKGGSGKSTIVSLMANAASQRGFHVLVVDSDESNSGLFRILGFDQPPVPLMEYLGGRKGLKEKMSNPNILAESDILIDNIPQQHILKKDGLRLVSIGKILQSLEGCACPMGVLSREFLKKLKLKKDEMVIVDTEAGVEHFGRGVEASLDSVLIVVEPSFESLELAARINGLANGIGIKNIWTILNKVPSQEIAFKLETELARRSIKTFGCIHQDAEVFSAILEGTTIKAGKASQEIADILNHILDETSPIPS
ncbi:ATP-binding protein [Chloroflexota bacterium]